MEVHQPQKILVRKEMLPDKEQYYLCEVGNDLRELYFSLMKNKFFDVVNESPNVIAWYEPAIRIVLTVEDYEKLNDKIKQLEDKIESLYEDMAGEDI